MSETCLEYRLTKTIDVDTNTQVLGLFQALKASDLSSYGILDLVPTYHSVSIHFMASSSLLKDSSAFDTLVKKLLESDTHELVSKHHSVKVNYDGEDLEDVCRALCLSKEELISLHAKSYKIAMIGFRPYFPYLLGLDERLTLPRRSSPRLHVKKGSVAIAAGQTGIYSEDSPGGWHIIGHTDFDGYESLEAGDTIEFVVQGERDAN